LEMSRQRLRSSLYEISTQPCPHCEASGRIPSLSTLALRLLRQAEDIGFERDFPHVLIQAPQELALYILNSKRGTLDEIEERYDITITVTPSPRLRMPHFDVRGFTEDKMQIEIERDSTLAAFVLGVVTYLGLQVTAGIFSLETFVGVFAQGFFAGIFGILVAGVILRTLGNEEFSVIAGTFHQKFWKMWTLSQEPEKLP